MVWELKGEKTSFFLGVRWRYSQRDLKEEHSLCQGTEWEVSRTR